MISRVMLLLAALSVLSPLAAARTEDVPVGGEHHPTCAETAERVLEPFLDRVEAAREIVEEGRAELAELDAWIAEREADAPGSRGARDAQRRRDVLAERLRSGEATKYQEELRFSASIRGWEEYAAKVAARRAERNREYAEGTVGLYHRAFRATYTRQRIDDLLFDARRDLDRARMREFGFYLSPLRSTYTGEGIDAFLGEREAELADARTRIAAGTFALYVRTLRHTTTREKVQERVAEKRADLAAVRVAWGARKYSAYNPKVRSTTTNGEIEERLAEARRDHPDEPEKAAYWQEALAQTALDGWGWLWAQAGDAHAEGDAAAALERGVDEADLRAALDRVEARLARATPDTDEAARLLTMRARFRALLRAIEGVDCP